VKLLTVHQARSTKSVASVVDVQPRVFDVSVAIVYDAERPAGRSNESPLF